MKIIRPYTEIVTALDGDAILKHIELCGRVCYKSEDKITDDSAKEFVQMLIDKGHEAMLEHYSFSVRFVCDRGISHELVRHRIASFSQESTRYCNYGMVGCTFILPCWFNIRVKEKVDKDNSTDPYFQSLIGQLSTLEQNWLKTCLAAEDTYEHMAVLEGWDPQMARSILPNSLKTEVIMTANLREWRHFFKLRTAKNAHPQMLELTVPLLVELKELIPVVFDDIMVEVEDDY